MTNNKNKTSSPTSNFLRLAIATSWPDTLKTAELKYSFKCITLMLSMLVPRWIWTYHSGPRQWLNWGGVGALVHI